MRAPWRITSHPLDFFFKLRYRREGKCSVLGTPTSKPYEVHVISYVNYAWSSKICRIIQKKCHSYHTYILFGRFSRESDLWLRGNFRLDDVYRQQPSFLLYSIDIWPALNSRITQCETNYYIARCASVSAWCYHAGGSPEQLFIEIFAQHQQFDARCELEQRQFQTDSINWKIIPFSLIAAFFC